MHISDKVICGVFGFVIGAAAGIFTAGRVYKKKLLQQELSFDIPLEDFEFADDCCEKKDEEEPPKPEVKPEAKPKATKAKSLEELSKEYGSDIFNREMERHAHPEDDGEYENDDETDEDSDEKDQIFIITDEEFRRDIQLRESETLTFYQGDAVLCDSTGDKITYGAKIIGSDTLEELATTEEDFVYVSNEYEDKMYEILVEHNRYFYRDVLGV